MSNGIVIHIIAGDEKRTEFFINERVRIGTDAACDLRIEPPPDHHLAATNGVWLELRRGINGNYRIVYFDETLGLNLNRQPLALETRLKDGDKIGLDNSELTLLFFTVPSTAAAISSLTRLGRETRVAPFIESAAVESAATDKRDDAKVFLKEFSRELIQEISWVTKAIVLLIVIGTLSGLFYLGSALYKEIKRGREEAQEQGRIISQLKDELTRSRTEIGDLNKTNKQLIDIVSLAATLRNEYGSGVCLLVGTYDLVDKATGKQLRYPDPTVVATPDPLEPQVTPQVSESGENFVPTTAPDIPQKQASPLTTEGNGTPVEYDFVGTGFHVGSGYLLTNRHVVQPWANDERIKVLAQLSNGRARLRRLVVYFPGFPNPFPVRVRDVSGKEDLAIAALDPNSVFPEIPVLPLDVNSDAVSIGKTVVTMGYPNGPERILAMVDESEARSIQARYGSNLQTLVNFLAQTRRIQPLTTQGTITDLDTRRIVHDAKTAEGGSGAPLFGQSGRVIGVNFGVFTENTAGNMAIPIKYAIPMLQRAGWRSPEQKQTEEAEKTVNGNTKMSNTPVAANTSQK
ncbi:MAG: serine protease [Acidobacteriota bacterium]|nr:serine protease [Acidobacteriota bacterium]